MENYIGTYKVVKIFRVSMKRKVLKRGLTREQAISLTKSYPSSKNSMVTFMKQFYAQKYFTN